MKCCYPVEAPRLPCIHTKICLTMLTRQDAVHEVFVGDMCFKQAFTCLPLNLEFRAYPLPYLPYPS